MDIVLATFVGSIIVFAFILVASKIPTDIIFWGAMLAGLLAISFAAGSITTDLLNITNFYKGI